jgi:carbamoyl-phosphate synthase small subunit
VKLILEDGSVFGGDSFGAERNVAGEVVFNTGMAGYVETLTDPSYRGQILVLTYPLIGNYGVPLTRAIGSIDRPFESNEIQVQGLIVQHHVEHFSHRSARRSLSEWLIDSEVPAMTGIDTRALTRKLREVGTMNGLLVDSALSTAQARSQARAVDMKHDVFQLVAPSEVVHYAGGDPRVLLVDVGAKDNIVRSLLSRGATVIRVPWHVDFDEYLSECDGVVIGNGPGDPKNLGNLAKSLREILGNFSGPVFGICLGHQVLSLAAGGDTYKLPYGHRGVNQPVRDLRTQRCYITSQNHGYAVRDDTLPEDWESWFVNVNDGTNEGVRSRTRPFMSVQFHPEASPGPQDTGFLFDEFLSLASSG